MEKHVGKSGSTMNTEGHWDRKPSTSSVTPPPQIKKEPRAPPSPTLSCATVFASHSRVPRPPSPTPSTASTATVVTGQNRTTVGGGLGQISIRPLASILDPDDNASLVSCGSFMSCRQSSPVSQVTEKCTQEVVVDDWRLSKTSVRDRLQFILEHREKYQDVVFEVQGKMTTERFEAHKLILRIASSVFDKIFQDFESTNLNKSSQTDKVISVTNVEPGTFKRLLTYIYTDEVELAHLNGEEILSLLHASKAYGVIQLYLECVHILKNGISDEVAVKLCELAGKYDDSLLMETALNHIARKAFEIFPSESFLQLSQENICKLIDRNDLRIKEISLFESVLRWAEFQCMQHGIEISSKNLRDMLQNVIPRVRFPLMSADEFTFGVNSTDILTAIEKVEIFQYICVEPSKRDKLPQISFITTPRGLKKEAPELEDDSFSDFQDGTSCQNDSPGRQPSLASNPKSDTTTTQSDSETTSNVSMSSDGRKRVRKLERSLSGSSRKRRKHEKRRNERDEKPSKSVQLEDLFGDFNDASTNTISKKGGSLSLKSFIEEWSKNRRRNEIEVIKLINVKVDDFRKLDGQRVHFPKLKEFNLNIIVSESIASIIPDFAVENLLFFSTAIKNWMLQDLWKMAIDITVILNNVIVLKMSPKTSHVILNKFKGAPSILRSLKDKQIKSVIFSHTQYSERNFPLSLKRLVLLGSINSINICDFLQQFRHLKDLTIVPTAAAEKDIKVLKLSNDFASKEKLRKLGIGSFIINVEHSVRLYNMEGLYLWRTSWETYFEEKFYHIFPKLKEISFIGRMKASPVLLKNIIKIASLTEVFSWACDWQLTSSDGADAFEMRKFITSCGLSETEKSFKLKKVGNGHWEGTKISFNASQEQIYSKLQYDFLYEDVQTFLKQS